MGPDELIDLRGPDDVSHLERPWRELVRRVGGSYFQLPDWALAWWRTLGSEDPTTVAVWHGDSGLDALAALTRRRVRLHPRVPLSVYTLVNTGSGPGAADHLGFPSTAERAGDVAAWIDSLRGGSIVLSSLAPGAAIPARAQPTERSPCPRMRIGPEHPIGRSARYRRQVSSKLRRACEAGVEFELVGPGTFTPELLDLLMDLHERRWSELEGRSSFERDRLGLHRLLVGAAAADRGPAAVVARLDGSTIGMVYGLVWNGTFAFFQSGWDPQWKALHLGTVVHAAAFELLPPSGVHTYDFLRGDEEYKYRFGATDLVDTSVLIPNGVGGVALRAKSALGSFRGGNRRNRRSPSAVQVASQRHLQA